VVWEEKRRPDVVIELLSDSTAKSDKGEKKEVYQNEMRVPDYFWYHPFTGELAGFTLDDAGVYQPLAPDEQGRLIIPSLGLALVRREGLYRGVRATWLRLETPDGQLLLHDGERAEQEKARAEQEKARADLLAAKLREMGMNPDELTSLT
jgi:Putative restriction endonuclease